MKSLLYSLPMLAMVVGCQSGAISSAPNGVVDFAKMDSEKIISNPDLSWKQFGPGGAGNNYYVYWHTTDPKTVYQGPNMGNSYRSTDGGFSYEGILDCDAPGGKSDRGPVEITPIEFSYQDEKFGFCSSEDRGCLYVTHDKGLTWQKDETVSEMIAAGNNHINAIKVDPKDDNIWYMGSGVVKNANSFVFNELRPHGFADKFQAEKRIGTREDAEVYDVVPADVSRNGTVTIWKSADKGKTWQTVTPNGLETDAQITELFIHPEQTNKLYAATTYGFYMSTDGGANWTKKVNTGLDNDIIRAMDMHYDRTTKKVTFVAIDLVKYFPAGKSITYNGGIFRSTDEGDSWQNITSDLAVDKQLLEGEFVNTVYYKMFLSNWFDRKIADVKRLYPELPEKLLQSFSVVKISPRNVNEIILINNYKSQYTFPGGMMWKTADGGNHWYVNFRNGKNFEGRDKEYWASRGTPANCNVTMRGQKEWERRGDYDQKAGATVAYNADGSVIMFQVAKVVCVSDDGGETWYENDEIDTSDDGSECWMGAGNSNMPGSEIVQDMRIKDHFYLCSGENSIWQTTNHAEQKYGVERQSVQKMKMPSKEAPKECSVGSMAVDPRNPNTLYCTHYRQTNFGKFMRSTDAGAHWEPIGTIFDVPSQYWDDHIHQNNITIDPNNPERIYTVIPSATIDDCAGQWGDRFYEDYGFHASFDGGHTWEYLNDGLPHGDIQMIAMSPSEKGVVYCAAMKSGDVDGGLYRLDDGAKIWKKVSTPNNMCSVHDIFFAQDGKMYISGGTGAGKVEDGGVWYTTDMKSWNQVFPYKIANHIRVAKYDSKVLMVSVPGNKVGAIIKNAGIYRSLDGGESWEKVNFGNIQADRLADLQIDYFRPGIYWCSTYGAGYYKGVDHKLLVD